MDSAIKNTGIISANGGKVILTAKVLNSVFDYAINNTGVIKAKSLVNHNGVVELTATGAPICNIGTGLGNIYINGMLTINLAALTAAANNQTKTYGTTALLTGLTASGLKIGDTVTGMTLINLGAVATVGIIEGGSIEILAPSTELINTGSILSNGGPKLPNGGLIIFRLEQLCSRV